MEQFAENIDHFDPNNPYVGDEKVPIQFYMGILLNDAKTEEMARPIFDDVECIRIFNSKNNIIDRPIRDTDKQRWPRQYAAWKSTGVSDPGGSGTRLEHWPAVTRAQAEELKYFKIFTVEHLADISDTVGQQVMGVQKLKAMAKAYVETAKGNAPFVKMQKELEARDQQITELTGSVAEMMAEVKQLKKTLRKSGVELPA